MWVRIPPHQDISHHFHHLRFLDFEHVRHIRVLQDDMQTVVANTISVDSKNRIVPPRVLRGLC